MKRSDALRGPTEPHLRLPRHRGAGEQRQVPAPLLSSGHSARQPGVVHGQPTGTENPERQCQKLNVVYLVLICINISEAIFKTYVLFSFPPMVNIPMLIKCQTNLSEQLMALCAEVASLEIR